MQPSENLTVEALLHQSMRTTDAADLALRQNLDLCLNDTTVLPESAASNPTLLLDFLVPHDIDKPYRRKRPLSFNLSIDTSRSKLFANINENNRSQLNLHELRLPCLPSPNTPISPVIGLYIHSPRLRHRCGRKLGGCLEGCQGHGFGGFYHPSTRSTSHNEDAGAYFPQSVNVAKKETFQFPAPSISPASDMLRTQAISDQFNKYINSPGGSLYQKIWDPLLENLSAMNAPAIPQSMASSCESNESMPLMENMGSVQKMEEMSSDQENFGNYLSYAENSLDAMFELKVLKSPSALVQALSCALSPLLVQQQHPMDYATQLDDAVEYGGGVGREADQSTLENGDLQHSDGLSAQICEAGNFSGDFDHSSDSKKSNDSSSPASEDTNATGNKKVKISSSQRRLSRALAQSPSNWKSIEVDGLKGFPCPLHPQCDQQFKRKHDLIRHMRIHTNEFDAKLA